MNENEYRAQRAVGTIDFRQAAVETKSKKVLARIVEDTQDTDARAAVALNPKTDVRTLTRIIVDRDTEDYIIDLCIWHPTVVEHVLKTWSEKDYMKSRPTLRSRLYGMQAANGIREEDRISLTVNADEIDWDHFAKKMMFPTQKSMMPYKTSVIGQPYFGKTTWTQSGYSAVDGAVSTTLGKVSYTSSNTANIDPDTTYYVYSVDDSSSDVADKDTILQMMNGIITLL